MPRKKTAFTAQKNPTAARAAATTTKAMTKDDATAYGRAAAEKMLKDMPEDILPSAILAFRMGVHEGMLQRHEEMVTRRMFAEAGMDCLLGSLPDPKKS